MIAGNLIKISLSPHVDWGAESAAVSVAPRLPLHLQDQRLSLWGRDNLVQGLVALLDRPDIEPRVRLLHGMGGCGKTSIAQQVAHEATVRGVDTWWVSADDSMLIAGMHIVAHQVGASDEDLRYGAADALWRCLGYYPKPWLLVLDGADDPSLLTVHGQESVAAGTGWIRPPPNGRGLVVVTTRTDIDEVWGSGEWIRRHHVGMLERDDAARVLLDYTGNGPGTPAEAEDLADRLGRLPLALSHAGAFLAENADQWDSNEIDTFAKYRDALSEGRLDMFPTEVDGPLTESDSRRIITRTWEMSLDLLDRQGMPQARSLLRLLSFTAAAPVPYKLLLRPATLATFAPFESANGAGLRRLLKALSGLRLLELPAVHSIDEVGNSPTVLRIHPLVRDTNRYHCEVSNESATYLTVVAALAIQAAQGSGDPEDPATWPAWHALAPHCTDLLGTIAHHMPDLSIETAGQAALAGQHAACYLYAVGLYEQAETELRAVLDVLHRLPDDNTSAILDSRNWLARALRDRGEIGDAEREFRAVYKARERLVHEVRPDTDGALAELARVGWQTKEGIRLLAHHGDLYAVRPVLDMLETYADLAVTLAYQHRPDEANEAYRAVYEAHLQILGETDPHTLDSRAGLAARLYDAGELEAAEREFRAVYEAEREVVGTDHPSTLTTRGWIAAVLMERGQLDAAEVERRAVYEASEFVLGSRHPQTVDHRRGLAHLLRHRGTHLFDGAVASQSSDAEGDSGMSAVTQEQASQLEQAMAAFHEARGLVDRKSDPIFYGVLSHDIGNVHYKAGRLSEAAEEYQHSADCEGLGGRLQEQAASLCLVGRIRRDVGQSDKALEAAVGAQLILRSMPEPPAHDLAEALVLAGDVLRVDQPAQALPHLQKAHRLLAEDEVGTPLEQVGVLRRIREAHLALNATDDAKATLDDVTKTLTPYAEEVLTGSDVAAVLELVGVLFSHEQYTQVRSALERAEALLSVNADSASAQRAKLTHNLGRTYEILGNRGEDWAYARARAAYQSTLGLIDPDSDPDSYATVLYDLADVHTAEGNPEEAADVYQKSAEHKGRAKNLEGQAQALRRVGEIHLQLGLLRPSDSPESKNN